MGPRGCPISAAADVGFLGLVQFAVFCDQLTKSVATSGVPIAGIGSLASLTKGHSRQLLLQPFPFLRIRTLRELIGERKEPLFLRFFGLQARLNQIHQDAIGAGLLSLRQGAHAPGNSRGNRNALPDGILGLSHIPIILHQPAP